MGKIIATYLVKVTLRESDDELAKAADAGETYLTPEPPTNGILAAFVGESLTAITQLSANATSERTDI